MFRSNTVAIRWLIAIIPTVLTTVGATPFGTTKPSTVLLTEASVLISTSVTVLTRVTGHPGLSVKMGTGSISAFAH